MSDSKKHRKCPHCKSTKGVEIMVCLGGFEEVTINFSGKELDRKRTSGDTIDNYGVCLSCGKTIDIEFLEMKNV